MIKILLDSMGGLTPPEDLVVEKNGFAEHPELTIIGIIIVIAAFIYAVVSIVKEAKKDNKKSNQDHNKDE